MASRFKVKKRTGPKSTKPASSLSAKRKMGFLILWSAFSVGIYLAASAHFAMTPIIVAEILLFLGLCAYFVLGIQLRRESIRSEGESDRLTALLDKQKLVLIFIIPLVFIILYDFIVTTVKVS